MPQPTNADATRAHAGLGDEVTWHYRVYASNAVGESGPSDSAEVTTFAPVTVTSMEWMMVDGNDDGRITGVDASALFFQAMDVGNADADQEVCRTLFGPLLPPSVDRSYADAVDETVDDVVVEIEATFEANRDTLDINGDGAIGTLHRVLWWWGRWNGTIVRGWGPAKHCVRVAVAPQGWLSHLASGQGAATP